ncbi:NAD-dependent epimerase/dehydratase [Magnetococcus marinus MC-1]|uniref:NAD-dependent epimerase/dehydratase n=1 Tax=Magnetococcus marinus (strain ATCC BAA-1437 / JCM 17883 / MC-1) TaxID=156889 RepID=A0L3Z4_MAGMM|nr:NAD-dependent epimerase/dehydratase family protein [Magnetococcus marinus]ABK42687.1 NAD-dependent epimerase/dehydratase [Magnetococcus marinus MC-1]
MATYLITGGCGFIGSHLADALLARGDGVRILDDLSTGKRENVQGTCEIILGDVADSQTVRQAMQGVDGCFHLAAVASVARSNEDWVGTHRINQTGSVNVFDAARHAKDGQPVPVVYASSAATYGACQTLPIHEDAPRNPLTAYGADKLGSELHAVVASGVHGVPTCGFRFFNVYGPRQDPSSPYSGVISIFTNRMRVGQDVTIFGDGGQTRDFVYVADVVAHLLAGMDRATGEAKVYNVCTGREITLLQLALMIRSLLDSKIAIHHGEPRAGDIRESLGDPRRATAELGVRAEITLEDGLKRLLDSLKNG